MNISSFHRIVLPSSSLHHSIRERILLLDAIVVAPYFLCRAIWHVWLYLFCFGLPLALHAHKHSHREYVLHVCRGNFSTLKVIALLLLPKRGFHTKNAKIIIVNFKRFKKTDYFTPDNSRTTYFFVKCRNSSLYLVVLEIR